MPHPAILNQYNQIIPGTAERILAMAEKNSAHKREMNAGVLAAEIDVDKRRHEEVKRGQAYDGVVVFLSFGVAALALLLGSPVTAGIYGGSTVVALAVVFVTGRESKHKPEHQKQVQETPPQE